MLKRAGLWMLLGSVLIGGIAVALLKSVAQSDTPWQAAVAISATLALIGLVLAVLTDTSKKRLTEALERAFRRTDLDVEIGAPHGLPLVADVPFKVLGIHEAIALPEDADPDLDPDLPTYVRRAVDATIANAITKAKKSGGFVAVRGEPGRGKTRSLYEAVRTQMPDWRFYVPDNPAELVERVGPHPVWWTR